MATYTPNYQLHQWVPEDQFRRIDFNEDFKKIDTALAEIESSKADSSSTNTQISSITSAIEGLEGRLQVQIGTYVGDGTAKRNFNLGYYPKAVLIEGQHGLRANGYGGLAFRGAPCRNGDNLIELTSNGFNIFFSGTTIQTNCKNMMYLYLVFR